MRSARWAAVLLAASAALAGCRDAQVERDRTSVLGGTAPPASMPTLTDSGGELIPPPPVPADAHARLARTGEGRALAVWVRERQVLAAAWSRAQGWTAPQPLERIYGDPGEPQLVSNGQGVAMAVWHHRVGNIHSLRFSRFDTAGGWSVPDVLPGAFPRPATAGAAPGQNAPQLEMDPQGNVVARWPSGFRADEMQVARYTAAEGWTRAAGEPLAAAPAPLPAASAR